MKEDSDGTSYRDAGVDIDVGNEAVRLIGPALASTRRPEVIGDSVGFGGLFALPSGYRQPVLVSGTDGVGTKLKVAFMAGRHHTVGIDLVAMSVNDILVQGAEPLFFLDYLAAGRLEAPRVAEIVGGVAEGCRQAGCSLLGGETAEMPGFYAEGEYDLAGFAVGVVEKDDIVDGSRVTDGDIIIGLASSGLHSNGYSLARKIIFDILGAGLDEQHPLLGRSFGDELLEPTRIYVRPLLELRRWVDIKGMAHITGGGLPENLPRSFGKGLRAVISKGSWPRPPIFSLLQQSGAVAEAEMYRTFNMGLGFVIIVDRQSLDAALERLRELGEKAYVIGRIEQGAGGLAWEK